VTQSGQDLGRVSTFDVDAGSQTITHYYVRTGLIKGLWHEELMVAASQVISISVEKMVVEDTVMPAVGQTVPQPVG